MKSTTSNRLAIIRRLYFYLVAFISLVTGLLAVRGLLDVLLGIWLDKGALVTVNDAGFLRNALAREGGLLLVSAPIFALHWLFIRRLAPRAMEARSALRKLFLYAVVAITVTVAATEIHQLVAGSTALALGQPLRQSALWPHTWLLRLLTTAIHLALLRVFTVQLAHDGDIGQEIGWAGTLRRLFQSLVGLVGLGFLLTGTAGLLEIGLRLGLERFTAAGVAVAGGDWWRVGVGEQLASLLIGGLLWRVNGQRWDRIIGEHPVEGRTALRRVYLYAATVLSAAAALVPAALLLRAALLYLFRAPELAPLPDVTSSLAFLPLGIIAWRWHWQQVHAEMRGYGDSPESATVRRLYYYSVAATGLVLLWIGLVDLLRALLDWAVVSGVSAESGFRVQQLANGLSLLAVGAPVWAVHWRTAQREARPEGEAGRAERGSGPRRAYLYGIALAGALLILFELAQVVYRLLLWILGEPNADIFGAETVDALVRSGTAAVFWAVHVLAIREDSRLADMEAEEEAETTAAERRAVLEARIRELEAELTAVRQELMELEV